MSGLRLFHDISQCVTMSGVAANQGRRPTEKDLGIIENAAIVVNGEAIEWIGSQTALPKGYSRIETQISGRGQVWLPALAECHTHLVYGGSRHHDYALRVAGKTYQEVAKAGGGILFTLSQTREASINALVEKAVDDLEFFEKSGVGSLEVKSGYGLTLETEIKSLECIARLRERSPIELVGTFMPAHATPPEFKGRTDEYVDVICREWIPEVARRRLATFFDVFVEEGYFSIRQGRKLCETALAHGFKIKLHVDQFKDLGSTELAVELGATSCDHLDNVSKEGVKKIAASDTVAVLLPGASLFTGTPYPPARLLIDAGARVALSTDYNPGTCPSRNLALMTTLACSQMKMTVPEAIAGVTYNAAAAIGLERKLGSLEVGKRFVAACFDGSSYERLAYSFGEQPIALIK